jgi:hypothetical protein
VSALVDLVQMSTFSINSPLSARNVFLTERGSRVVLGRIDWGEKMPIEDFRVLAKRESALVRDFGVIVSQALGLDQQRAPEPSSRDSGATETTEEGRQQFVFSRVECDVGITIKTGELFRLDLPCKPRRVWRCIRVTDARSVDPASNRNNPLSSSVVRLDNPERLEFSAKTQPGSCRVLLQEVEWWQADDLADVDPLKPADGVRGTVLLCKINVVDPSQESDRSSCSPTLSAIMAACRVVTRGGAFNEVKLANLRDKYHVLNDNFSSDEVSSDFDTFTGAIPSYHTN